MTTVQDQRVRDRAAVVEVVDADPQTEGYGLFTRASIDYWEGTQYFSIAIEPPQFGYVVLPPGLDHLPEPGEAAVSPALAREIDRNPLLKQRYPQHFLIAPEGLSSPDEYLAWVRPQSRDAFFAGSVNFTREFNLNAAVRSAGYASLESPQDMGLLLVFAGMATVLPSLILMLAGLSAASRVREERIRLLHRLGFGTSKILRLNLIEAGIYALPLSVLVPAAWWFYARNAVSVPLTGRDVFRGDLSIPTSQLSVIAIAGIVLALVTASIATLAQRERVRQKPILIGRVFGFAWRPILVIAAVIIGALGAASQSEQGMLVYGANVLVIIAVAPAIVGSISSGLGRGLENSSNFLLHIAGARLARSRNTSNRPVAWLSVIVVVTVLLLTLIGFMTNAVEYVDHSESPSSAEIKTPVDRSAVVADLQSAMPDILIVDLIESDEYYVGADCRDVAIFLDRDPAVCAVGGSPTTGIFGNTFYYKNAIFDPSRRNDPREPTQLLVVSHSSMDRIDAEVRAALPPFRYPQLRVLTPEQLVIKAPPDVPWVQRRIAAFLGLSVLIVLCAMMNQVIHQQRSLSTLARMGSTFRSIRAIEWVSFLTSSTVAIGIGAAIGGVLSYAFGQNYPVAWSKVPIGWFGMWLVAGVVAGAIVTGIMASAVASEG